MWRLQQPGRMAPPTLYLAVMGLLQPVLPAGPSGLPFTMNSPVDTAIKGLSGESQLAFAGAAARGQHELSGGVEAGEDATIDEVTADFTSDRMRNPNNLLFGRGGELFVSSFTLDHVLRFEPFTRQPEHPQLHAKYSVFAKELDGPSALALDTLVRNEGGLFVASFGGDEVFRFDVNGTLLRRFGVEEEVDCPEGVAVGPDDLLYVSSWHRGWIVRYNIENGAFLGQFGSARSKEFGGSKHHSFPEELVFLNSGHLLVSYFYSSSLIRYNGTNGAEIEEQAQLLPDYEIEAEEGSGNDEHSDQSQPSPPARRFGPAKKVLRGPVGLAIGPHDGHIYVASMKRNVVLRLDGVTGALIDVVAAAGELKGLSGLSFAPDGALWVTSYEDHRLMRYNIRYVRPTAIWFDWRQSS